MKKILIIGHSHLHALQAAQTRDNTFHFHSMIKQNSLPEKADSFDSIVCSISGNMHNVFGLLNHPKPFEFDLPEYTNLPIDSNSYLLPVNLIKKTFESRMQPMFSIMHEIIETYKLPTYHIESPPPIPSEVHIKEYPGLFKDKIDQLGISPATFRYKLWRLHSKIVSENCKKMGIIFIDVPQESLDAHGFLNDKCWGKDPTHGNSFYGDLVLNQIRTIHAIDKK